MSRRPESMRGPASSGPVAFAASSTIDPVELLSRLHQPLDVRRVDGGDDDIRRVQHQARDGVQGDPLLLINGVPRAGEPCRRHGEGPDPFAQRRRRGLGQSALRQLGEVFQAGSMHILVTGGPALGGGDRTTIRSPSPFASKVFLISPCRWSSASFVPER